MKSLIIALVAVLLSPVAFAQSSATSKADGTASLAMAADFTERDITNVQTVSLAGYRGKVVMLNFWGPWCPPCRLEVPDLEALQRTYKDKLVVIGATVFSSEAPVFKFYKEYKINYPVIWGSWDLMDKYGQVSSFPTTVIIDAKGRIVQTVVGSRTSYQFDQLLKPLLAQE